MRCRRPIYWPPGRTVTSIYRYLRRYWKRGQTKNGLLPDFKNCGAPGNDRLPGDVKRGRPPKLNRVDGTERGINIGPEESRFIQMGMKLFYENAAAPNPPSLRRAYRDTLGKYFNSGLIIKGGVSTPTFGSTHELPSLGQVLYWYK